jgi:hypothetical protein
MTSVEVAGRNIPEVYSVTGKTDLHDAIIGAIALSGGTVLYASGPDSTPFFFGVQSDSDQRIGLLVYPFRMRQRVIKHRPTDEVRAQIRYGSEPSWLRDHPLSQDIAGVDTTLVLCIDPDTGNFLGLDPALYDPLPMGISVYAKSRDLLEMGELGWTVLEKENRPGKKREESRSLTGLETVVVFRPERLLDFARLERRATDLSLDTSLRYTAAAEFRDHRNVQRDFGGTHALERQFDLNSQQILEIIASRSRLQVAVRGGVAEYHLEKQLKADPDVLSVERLDLDSNHDFNVTLRTGQMLRVECKNASPHKYSDGDYKVEVQKTRASKSDQASRFYPTC